MRKYFCPDFCFDTFKDATADFLKAEGIRFLILDIDNTLAPYEQPEPDQEIYDWFASLKDVGVSAAFVSNNNHARVDLFNKNLGFPAFPKGGKPKRRGMCAAMKAMGAKPEETAIMGDQIFTDVWAGKRMKIRTILVPPIKDKRDIFTRFKRLLEKPIKGYYKKKAAKKEKREQIK